MRSAALACLCAIFAGVVHSASNTWTGAVDSNWDNSTANWTSPAVWAGGDDAVFGAGVGTVDIIANITAASINAPGGSTVLGIGGGNTLQISTASSVPWAKMSGSGTLALNSAASYDWGLAALPAGFTGMLRLDKGRTHGAPSAFGGATAIQIANGAQFLAFDGTSNSYIYTPNFTLAGMGWGESGQEYGALRVSQMNATFSGNVTLTGNTGFYTQTSSGGTLTLSGAVSDAGGGHSLAINAYANPVTLSGTAANTLSGVTSVNRGTLILSKSADTASVGSLTISPVTGNNNTLVYATANNQFSSGAVVAFNGTPGYYSRLELLGTTQTIAGLNDTTTNGIVQNREFGPANSGTGTLVLNGSGSYSFASIGGGGLRNGTGGTIALTKGGTGTQTLSGGGITYSGPTIITGGVLRLVDATGFNSSGITDDAALVLGMTGGAWSMTKTVTGIGSLAAELAGGAVLTLGSVNTYGGSTSISSGLVVAPALAPAGSASSIGSGAALTLDGGTLRYTGSNVGNDTLSTQFNRAIQVGAGGGTLDVAGSGFLFYNGSLTGSASLTVVDTSGDANNRQLLVTGNSPSFSGGVFIGNGAANSGWVQVRSNAASPLGSGTVTLNTGGILSTDHGASSPSLVTNALVLNGGTLMSQGAGVAFSGPVMANIGTTSYLAPSSSANVVLTGSLSGNGAVTVVGGSHSVELHGDNSAYAGTYRHTGAGATIFYTANSASAGAAWEIPSGSPASARLMAGGSNATYHLGSLSGTTGLLENLNAASGNSIFEIGAQGTSTTFGGKITNNGGTVGITKTGAGTLTLTADNDYTGTTTVQAGALVINGTHANTAGLIHVNAGATIGGSGVTGDVVLEDGAIFSPGNSAGVFTVRDLYLSPGSILDFELGSPNLGAAPGSDRIVAQQFLQLDGMLTITPIAGFDAPALVAGDRWLLMTYLPGNIGDSGLELDAAPALLNGLIFEIDSSIDGEVYLAVVPEAGTSTLVLLGLILLLRRGFR